MLQNHPQPQHVVGDSAPSVVKPQEVERLQHRSYIRVNDPRKIICVARSRREQPGHGTARSQGSKGIPPPHPATRSRFRLPREPTGNTL